MGGVDGALPAEYLATMRDLLRQNGDVTFGPGLSDEECEEIEQRFGFRFPPDLRSFLQFAMPISHGFWDWRNESEERLREWLNRPVEAAGDAIDCAQMSLNEAGYPHVEAGAAYGLSRDHLAHAPRLIPIWGHRYIPDRPHEPGNPVFSVWGVDIIYYGYDLADYFSKELGVPRPSWAADRPKPIEFWDLFL